MTAELRVDTSDLGRELARLSAKVSDFRPAWPKVDKYTTLVLKRQFATEGAFLLGRRWAPWTRAWARRRPRPGGNRGGILRDTNRLWASFTKPRAPEGITRFGRLEYQRGSVDPRASLHQSGTSRMPARPVLPDELPAAILNTYAKIIVQHLDAR